MRAVNELVRRAIISIVSSKVSTNGRKIIATTANIATAPVPKIVYHAQKHRGEILRREREGRWRWKDLEYDFQNSPAQPRFTIREEKELEGT